MPCPPLMFHSCPSRSHAGRRWVPVKGRLWSLVEPLSGRPGTRLITPDAGRSFSRSCLFYHRTDRFALSCIRLERTGSFSGSFLECLSATQQHNIHCTSNGPTGFFVSPAVHVASCLLPPGEGAMASCFIFISAASSALASAPTNL